MAVQVERTLEDLRTELKTRLGFVTPSGVTLLQDKLLDSFLNEAQEVLWFDYDFPRLNIELIVQPADFPEHQGLFYTSDNVMMSGQTLYDPPDDCDPRLVSSVSIEIGEVWRGEREGFQRGIDPRHDTYTMDRTEPRKYDWIGDQLQLWPTPQQTYPYKLNYYRRALPMTENGDRCSVDSRLCFQLALISASKHYGRDASSAEAMFNRLSDNIKQAAHGNLTYNRLDRSNDRGSIFDPIPRMDE